MKTKQLENIPFEFGGEEYEFGFTLKSVKALAGFALAKGGRVTDVDFFKHALTEFSNAGFLTDAKVNELRQALLNGIDYEEDHFSYEELVEYILVLYGQAIDNAAMEVSPAVIKINDDSTVMVNLDGKDYKLMFTRKSVEDIIEAGVFDTSSILTMYATGSAIIKASLQHYKTRLSNNLHDEIFLSIWATGLESEDGGMMGEIINALMFHMGEVVDEGVKKSKAVIKTKKR